MMNKTILNNGLTVLTNTTNEDFVSIAYVVNKGAHDEPLDALGIAHLAEHVVFKGTANRDYKKLWEDVEQYGGSMNAMTTYSHTAFTCTILKEYWKVALDVLSDIVWNNTIPDDEFELEKTVVVEELKMYRDDGERRVFDLCNETVYKDYPNRRTNGGTPETVQAITRNQLVDFINNNYIPKNTTVIVSGNVSHEDIVSFVDNYIDGYEFAEKPETHCVEVQNVNIAEDVSEPFHGTQTHMIAYWPIQFTSLKDYLVTMITCKVMGGSFGSRFMEIRERYGFAYVVSCCTSLSNIHEIGNMMMCYTASNKQNIQKIQELIIENIKSVVADGITEKEFERAKNCCISGIKREFIFCDDYVGFIFTNMMYDLPFDENDVISTLESITMSDVQDFICKNFDIDNVGFIVCEQTE